MLAVLAGNDPGRILSLDRRALVGGDIMRRFAIFALALAFGAPACDDDNPVGPST